MAQVLTIPALFLAIFWSAFLFWRALRHEFIEAEVAFDTIIVAALGGLLGARIFDFLANSGTLGLSIKKLIFFNAYGGFDFWGGILGAGVAVFFFLRQKKVKTLYIFDLAAAPIVFGQAVFNLSIFLISRGNSGQFFGYIGLYYLLIFVILKRLATKKRHFGFFICFYIVSVSIFNLLFFAARGETVYIGEIPYHLVLFFCYLVLGLVFWYRTAKRVLTADIKNISAKGLLSVFKFKRAISSANEAGGISKAILFSPMFLVKGTLFIIKLVVREIRLGVVDFLYVLGLRHDRY